MALIPISNAGEYGVIYDRKPHELPLNAWSAAQNIRFRDGYAEKFLGESQWNAASVVPYFLLGCPQPTSYPWLYAGLNKVYTVDGSTHTNITRQTLGVDVDYAATASENWTGGLLNGVPVINNGIDVPQKWLPVNSGTKLEMLTNWNSAWTCKAMRPFKSFLVAMDVTKTGVRYPQMVKWSHPADSGALPVSWDETDPTKDAGEYSLAETSGFVLDCAALRDVNVIYKEDAIYTMQFIGGVSIFRFAALSKQLGLMSRRCVVEFMPGLHAAFCIGDVVQHDGQQVKSIVDEKIRRWLFNNIDQTYYGRSFVVNYAARKEVWFCFPMTGNAFPNMAMVWNHTRDTIGFRQLQDTAHIATGLLTASSATWASDVGTWAADTEVWDARPYSAAELSLVGVRPSASSLTQLDNTNQLSGSSMTVSLERTGIAVPWVDKQPPDFSAYKFFRTIWPRLEGTDGGQIQVEVGTQNQIDGPVTWEAAQTYVIGTTQKIDCRSAGRLLAIRFSSTSDVDWRLHGYEIEVLKGGRF